jgi:hypothetical protein
MQASLSHPAPSVHAGAARDARSDALAAAPSDPEPPAA